MSLEMGRRWAASPRGSRPVCFSFPMAFRRRGTLPIEPEEFSRSASELERTARRQNFGAAADVSLCEGDGWVRSVGCGCVLLSAHRRAVYAAAHCYYRAFPSRRFDPVPRIEPPHVRGSERQQRGLCCAGHSATRRCRRRPRSAASAHAGALERVRVGMAGAPRSDSPSDLAALA